MKTRTAPLISLCVLLAAYCVFRYPLFGLYGMKQFPLLLLAVGIAVIAVFGIVKGGRTAPLYTTVGYIVGFIAASTAGIFLEIPSKKVP